MEFSVLRAAEMEAPANQLRVEASSGGGAAGAGSRVGCIARRCGAGAASWREGILPRAAAAEVSE